jgi:gamma-tubulin complex component 2
VDGLPRKHTNGDRPSSSRLPSQTTQPRPSRLSQANGLPFSSSSHSEPSSSRREATEADDWRNRNGKSPDRGEPHAGLANGINGEEEGVSFERLLDGVPLEVQEAWICEDLLFVMQVRKEFGVPRSSAELRVRGSRGH